MTARQPAARA